MSYKFPRSVTAGFVTYLLMGGFFTVLWFLITTEAPTGNKDILNILIGVLGAKFSDAVGYWINSSASSRNKDAAIANTITSQIGKE